jgi:CMP-N-acetylneuraminic acid synthetase
MKNIVAVIPIRKGSVRVPNKNFKEFYNGKNLLELKIETLLKVNGIDDIVVNTDSDDAILIAKKYGISFYKREEYYASSICSQSDFFKNLAETTNSKYVLHTPVTSPIVTIETYQHIINMSNENNYDSYNTVADVKDFLWLDGKSINYDIDSGSVPNSQDLPNIVKLTFGINLTLRNTMISRSNVVGYNPYFHKVSGFETLDIDTPLDFEFSKFIYNHVNDQYK